MTQARAAVTDGHGHIELADVEVAEPGPGEVRLALAAAGLCHTDLELLNGGQRLILGHEGAGHVEQVGAGVEGLAPGDAVVLNWAMPCGHCAACRRGEPFLCYPSAAVSATPPPFTQRTRWRGAVLERAFALGTFSSLTVVPRSAVTRVPPGVPMAHACIAGCGVMTGVGSVLHVARVQAGDSVAVLGCGGVGLSAVQGARIAGATRIVAIDRQQARLYQALLMGATDAVLVGDSDSEGSEGEGRPAGAFDEVVSAVQSLTAGLGVDHAFECTGVAALAFKPLLLVRHGGQVLQLSGGQGEQGVPAQWFRWNKRYSVPLYGGCVPERDFPLLFEHVLEGRLQLASLAAPRYRLEQAAQALQDLRAGRIVKGVIELADGAVANR
jgi:S-(hydroxymethyl)glutathione dehydrogenase / alcohol dehydrogenase